MKIRTLEVGSTLVLNTVSLLLMSGSGLLALVSVFVPLERKGLRAASETPISRGAG